jgi:predicted enzyme related to lactoylglutathione lyase
VRGTDAKALQAFYGSLFGWTYNTDHPAHYGVVTPEPGRGIPGGVGPIGPDTKSWTTFYVETPDINASLQAATHLGGTVVMPRTELHGVTIGVFADPEGHVVGLIEAHAA